MGKRVNIKMITDPEKLRKISSKPTYISSKIFKKGDGVKLMVVHMKGCDV